MRRASLAYLSAVFLLVFGILYKLVYEPESIIYGELLSPKTTGLYYQTSSGIQGYTVNGKFEYRASDKVTFSLGDGVSNYQLGSAVAQPFLTTANIVTSPKYNNNMLRVFAALDQKPSDTSVVLLSPDLLSEKRFQQAFKLVDWYSKDFSIAGITLPSVEQASTYIQHNEISTRYNKVVLKPLNQSLSSIFVQLRRYDGELCFYDLDKANNDNYQGPIGHVTFKVVDNGIYEYPDIGDHFSGCELDVKYGLQRSKFTEIEDFTGFGGIVACARKGCRQSDLSGFSIDDYAGRSDRKYRSVALSFDQVTKLIIEKKQGLGKKPGVKYQNEGEGLIFTTFSNNEQQIDFNGIWLETRYTSDGRLHANCLMIRQGKVYTSDLPEERCDKGVEFYTLSHPGSYSDMWWLTPVSSKASLGQLNTPVKWSDNSNTTQYTRWEYMPVGRDWQSGTLYRFAQHVQFDDNGKQKVSTKSVTEYRKLTF